VAACREEAEEKAETSPAAAAQIAAKPGSGKASEPVAVLERTIDAHSNRVLGLAVSPDGTWIASGGEDENVMIHDLATGKRLATLKGHTGTIRSVAILPDGKWILSSSSDHTVRVWDLGLGKEVGIYRAHSAVVWSVVPFPDGRRAVSGSGDRTIAVWSIDDCRTAVTHEIDGEAWAAVSRDGRRIVSATMADFRVWDVETNQCLKVIKNEHTQITWSIALSRDGRFLVSGSDDKTVRIWDLEQGCCAGVLEGHPKSVWSVAISPDDRLILSSGWRQAFRLWDLHSGICLGAFDGAPNAGPHAVAFSPDATHFVVGTLEGPILVYRLTQPAAAPLPTRRYVNAKVVLVGESGVGKSGLAHRLIENRFVQTDSTHGMQVWQLSLSSAPSATEEREALLWDLAGQEDYRLIHQLFLDQTALALVLVNPQKEDPFADALEWLKALKSAVNANQREVVRLLIAARTDVGSVTVSQQKIDRFLAEQGFADYLPTSALTGAGCSDSQAGGPSALKALIEKHIPWGKLAWTSTPEALVVIKQAVIELRDDKAIRLLRFAELCQRLQDKLPKLALGEADVRTAVTLLANHGLVMAFAFGDLVLLRPELLNGYANAVIRAARAHVDEIGCVAEADVFERRLDMARVDRLPTADEDLLLRAMVQTFLDHSLCIAEDTAHGRHLVFPSQFRRERPMPAQPEIFLSYSFVGELQTIYTTLVVRLWYSSEFRHKELWRNAAELSTPLGQTVGLVMERLGEGEARLCVFFDQCVPDELKMAFLEYVRRHLDRFGRDVRRERRYTCGKCKKPITDAEAIRSRLAAKKDFIRCQHCDSKVVLIDQIERALGSDPVARKVQAMDDKAQQGLDTQALEQILIGHMLAICGEANQIYRPVTMFDYGIDGEVEFKDDDGQPSGHKIYVQLKSGDSHLRRREHDGNEVFDVKNPRHLDYWASQPVDVYLVVRTRENIRWMNLTRYLKTRPDRASRQIVFEGEKLDATAVWHLRDRFIPPRGGTKS
jgi:small GTP-binding protein